MHESGLVGRLLDEAELAGAGSRIAGLRLRIGALAATSPGHLRATAEQEAAVRWGECPPITIERSDDPTDPGAFGVTLVSVTAER